MLTKIQKLATLLKYLDQTKLVEEYNGYEGKGWCLTFDVKTSEIKYCEYDVDFHSRDSRNVVYKEVPETLLSSLMEKYEKWAIAQYNTKMKRIEELKILDKIYKGRA